MQEYNISAGGLECCLKCNICTSVCPVMAVNPSYPGPKQAGPDGQRYRLKDPLFFDAALDYCLNCKRCEVACPSGVKVGDIIQNARLEQGKKHHVLRNYALASTDLVGSLSTTLSPLVNGVLGLGITKALMHGLLGVDRHRTFPEYASQTFETWFKKNASTQEGFSKYVSFFHGCYANYNYPELGKDFVRVLNACGYGVHLLEKEKCCGVALISNGFRQQAVRQALDNISSIRAASNASEPVLTCSSTCTLTIREEYDHVLGLDCPDMMESVFLAVKWLYEKVESGQIELVFKQDYQRHLAYHTSCHMNRLGWSIYSIELLKKITGVKLTVLDQNCCGIAGTYGFKKENYACSQAIGKTLFDSICAANPDAIVSECETCKWQIEMSTQYKVINPISVLAEALDIEKTKTINEKSHLDNRSK